MANLLENNAINITINEDFSPDMQTIKKMAFIFNAVNDGWAVVKQIDSYHFTKKHEGRKEVYSDAYLKEFIERNMNITTEK
ncbi:MAG: hypothetical protein CMI79_03680 [Candidatus Pelagibacter sp.]|nr:hypothetical protein [Candidatus Pelagibacter sp.]